MSTCAKDEALLTEAISLLTEYSVITSVERVAREITEKAWQEVDSILPESPAKKLLKELAELMLSRKV